MLKIEPCDISHTLHRSGNDSGPTRSAAASVLLREKAVEFFKKSTVIPAQELARENAAVNRARKLKMNAAEIEDRLSTSQGLQVGVAHTQSGDFEFERSTTHH